MPLHSRNPRTSYFWFQNSLLDPKETKPGAGNPLQSIRRLIDKDAQDYRAGSGHG